MMAVQTQGDAKLRGLKLLVSVLGVLILLGTALVIGVVIKRIYARPEAPSMAVAATRPPSADFNALPAGSHISGLSGAGNEFAIWVTGPGGDRVYLLNPQTGALNLAIDAPK